MYHVSPKVSLMVENVSRIKSGITISVSVSINILKNIMRAKKITFGTMLHVLVKIVNI